MGSNIDAEKNLQKAAQMLRKAFKGIKFSSMYRSKALLRTDQEDFLNAAAVFETEKSPEDVQKALQKIEKALKKAPPHRYGPRTIDLDILLFGNEIRLEDELTIPHLDLHLRRFVLEPLIELGAGDILHPGFEVPLKSYLESVKNQSCEKTSLKPL